MEVLDLYYKVPSSLNIQNDSTCNTWYKEADNQQVLIKSETYNI